MKLIVYLFAFYLLLLPVMGIADNAGCDQVAHAEETTKAGANHEEDHEENCSPFCNCSCCFHTAPSHFELQKLPPIPFSYRERNYDIDIRSYYPSGILEAIWQPPKW